MASKEATIFIVDVGQSTSEQRHDREQHDLDWTLEYVWDKITSIVATERKTLNVGVIGLRTDETQNELDTEDGYEHITVLKPLGQCLMSDIRQLKDQLKPSNTESGDALSALAIAIQMISSFCKALKYERRIVLVTNGRGLMDTDDIEEIAGKIANDNIELTVLGVDFDDPEYGVKEEDKNEDKAKNEQVFQKLCEGCNGIFGTIAQAVEELSIPRLKTTKPVPSYKGHLTLGNREQYDGAFEIDVERYPRVMVQRPPTASTFVQSSGPAPGASHDERTAGDMAAVKNARSYQVVDENAPGGKRDVSPEELAKGYSYGSTAVPISESDRNVTTFETKQGMDILGFVTKQQYERYMDLSRSNVIIGMRTNDKANLALSSFIHALFELDSYAVARLVTKIDKAPLIVLLAPSIELDHECLYEVELPFAEDVRSYRFPSLDKVVTVSGKQLKQHRNLPNDDLMNAMSDYVDAMDLTSLSVSGSPIIRKLKKEGESSVTEDEDEEEEEYMNIDDTFSPVLHRINQVIRHRAIHPTKPLPPVPEILTKYSTPPATLTDRAQPLVSKILDAADLKKVPPKTRSRHYGGGRKNKDAPKPLSGLDVTALLSSKPPTNPDSPSITDATPQITAANAIPDFKSALLTTTSLASVQSLFTQFSAIIKALITSSFGDANYQRALEALRVMREEAIDFEAPEMYNDFLRALKKDIVVDDDGESDRREMWYLIRKERLGLVTSREAGGDGDVSSPAAGGGLHVSEEEAREFMAVKPSAVATT
ncbi:hypothetical protein AAFC00_004590 [Neodothiora populina]|uniref:ATP-dependent DNA helicase II subunit 2 n=1 Tax=Neodothiora populina TaxID=2781224 RepID=A0ABR3P3W2_9PEZI